MTTVGKLLTTREVAELLNVSSRTVTNWIRAGRVAHVRLPGGEYRLPLDGLLDSLTGTYDLRTRLEGAVELEAGERERRRADQELPMRERLARVHRLSMQMTAIKGKADR